MYCVIQAVELKKANKYGHYKELKSGSYKFSIGGVIKTKYFYEYSHERFERPIKTAYKISIHESKRVNGVVTKKQYAVTTIGYYYMSEWYDYLYGKKLDVIAQQLSTDTDYLWDLISAKIEPLVERIKSEFEKTDEYKTYIKHKKIIDSYCKEKKRFSDMYECDDSEYDYCFNVFGEIMEPEYFEKVFENYEQRRSYQKQSYSNHTDFDWEAFKKSIGYMDSLGNNHNEDEKEYLKKFYKILAAKFHPDANLDKDTTKEMQFLNKLKNEWGI